MIFQQRIKKKEVLLQKYSSEGKKKPKKPQHLWALRSSPNSAPAGQILPSSVALSPAPLNFFWQCTISQDLKVSLFD